MVKHDTDELHQTRSKLNNLNKHLQNHTKEKVAKKRDNELMIAEQSSAAQVGRVISMIAHQWRQYLNNLYLLNQKINLLYKSNRLDEMVMEEFQKSSLKQIEQMSETINEFSDFFKFDKEKIRFDFVQVVRDTLEVMAPVLDHLDIKTDIIIEPQTQFSLQGYPGELQQAMINLVNNAKDALLESSKNKKRWIKIALYSNEERLFLEVSDSAGGIPKENLDRVFEPYFSTRSQKHGAGLGLCISKMIVEEHEGGVLSVTNGEEGAIFTMSFLLAS